MRYLLILILLCFINPLIGQTLDDYYPNEHGVTHHFIKENKIEMMKDAQFAIDNIKNYRFNRNLGYGLVAVGVGTLYYASSHMDVPIRFSNGNDEALADRNRRNRLIVGSIGVVVAGVGTYIVIKNCKLLKKIEIRLQPNAGGLKFYI